METNGDWGGAWTEEKLGLLRGYLVAYLTALKNKPFRLGYIDAFAGAGYRAAAGATEGQLALTGEPVRAYRDGSARIAIELDPAFDAYVFIEKDPVKVAELEELRSTRPDRTVHIHEGDANAHLRRLCGLDWSGRRAVVFLDPYGMQVEWATLEALASTEAVDVWTLVPLGVALNRMLARDMAAMQPGWSEALDRYFGTGDWREALYESPAQRARRLSAAPSLFPDSPAAGGAARAVDLDGIGRYFRDRLRSIFPYVASKHRVLRSPSGLPLYILVFAAANPEPKAGGTALRIANHLLGGG